MVTKVTRRMANVRSVIFDKEGVLVNTIPLNRKHAVKVLAQALHGIPPKSVHFLTPVQLAEGQTFYDLRLGHSTESMLKEVIRDAVSTANYVRAYKDGRDAELNQKIAEDPWSLVFPGVPALLELLSKRGVGLCIASAASPQTDTILVRTGVHRYFSYIENCPGLAEKISAIERLTTNCSTPLSRTLFFDDALAAVKAAREKFGPQLIICGLPSNALTNEQMIGFADFTLPDFNITGFNPLLAEIEECEGTVPI